MNHALPFSGNRFELEGEHTYFLQDESFGRLQTESPKPVYLTGPRGTGKTTLLKAFDLRERRQNASLREQLGVDPFNSPAGPFIGVYFRAPNIQLGLIEEWGRGEPEEAVGKALALYIDLQWLQEIARSIARLLADGLLVATAGEERRIVENIVAEYPRTLGASRRSPQTVAELRTALKNASGNLDYSAKTRADWSAAMADCDAIQQFGAFGRFVASELSALCMRPDDAGRGWHFRVCIDEADTLTDLQLRSLNSMVRLCEWPVFPIAAFGGVARDFTSTLLPHLSVQDADCDIIDLSEFLTARRFRDLAEGVASARVSRLVKERTSVSLVAILGDFGINSLLRQILSESVSPRAKELIELAKDLQQEPFFKTASDIVPPAGEDTDSEPDETDELPIYQAYLVSRLNIKLPTPENAWKRRRQESGDLRKKMIAAYLSICAELNTHARYASARVVLHLSDLCIRDFLKFLNALHRASGLPVQEFIAREMVARDQHEALLAASREKSQAIRGQDLRAPRETEAVVNGLARVTHLLQTQGEDYAHLRTSERGVFFLPSSRWRADADRAAQAVRDACDAGFLRFLSEDDTHVTFRVHSSLAPAFQFSYRGAYYPAALEWSDVEKLGNALKPDDFKRIAEGIYRRGLRAENLSLFDPS